jgi:hypothetical protein
VFQQHSTAVTSHVSVLAVEIESRSDAVTFGVGIIAGIALLFVFNWLITRNSKRGYRRFVNWTSAQRAEARQRQAEDRRRPSPVALATRRQAKIRSKTGSVLGLVGFAFGGWAMTASTPVITWTASVIFGVLTVASLTLLFIGIYLELKASRQQYEYD